MDGLGDGLGIDSSLLDVLSFNSSVSDLCLDDLLDGMPVLAFFCLIAFMGLRLA